MKKKSSIKTNIIISYCLITILVLATGIVSGLHAYNDQDYGMLLFAVIVFCLQLGLCLVFLIRVNRDISRPMGEIMQAAQSILKGDMNITMHKENNDEFGVLIDILNGLLKNSMDQAQIAYRIAQGDLTMDIQVKSENDLLGKALSELVEDNNVILSNIKESTMQVTAGAGQVSDASSALAQGSTEQASAIEQITASLDEIAEKTKDNASLTAKADQLVHEVRTASSDGKQHMKEMTEAMRAINDSSENISKVIKVIDDIAFQTNLLALNATVEAARAGVHGKGFAVVAEEVRNLAEKSAAAANETNELIQDSIRKVHNGSEHAKETSLALEGIHVSIGKTVELIDNIATASSEQATAITQIDQAILQVSQVVQTNSATSQECASASEELANQAENLRDLMGKYKLKNTNYGGTAYAVRKKSRHEQEGRSGRNEADNERIISLNSDFGKY